VLRVALDSARHGGIAMPHEGLPIIRRVAGDPTGLQQRCALQRHLVLMLPKDRRQNLLDAMIPLASADQYRIIPACVGLKWLSFRLGVHFCSRLPATLLRNIRLKEH